MTRVSKKKAQVPLLCYTAEAQAVDSITKALRKRSGIHLYKGVEIASVFDLVVMCQRMAQRMAGSYQANTIHNWIKVFGWAVEAKARALACKRQLETDHGVVEIGKRRSRRGRPTYFIAIEDFHIYLEAVCRRHPVVGKRLQRAWELIRSTAKHRQPPQVAFNFQPKEQTGRCCQAHF